jgi:hypothetical protein
MRQTAIFVLSNIGFEGSNEFIDILLQALNRKGSHHDRKAALNSLVTLKFDSVLTLLMIQNIIDTINRVIKEEKNEEVHSYLFIFSHLSYSYLFLFHILFLVLFSYSMLLISFMFIHIISHLSYSLYL